MVSATLVWMILREQLVVHRRKSVKWGMLLSCSTGAAVSHYGIMYGILQRSVFSKAL